MMSTVKIKFDMMYVYIYIVCDPDHNKKTIKKMYSTKPVLHSTKCLTQIAIDFP